MSTSRHYHIAVLPGDGVGPEVVDAALCVLKECSSGSGFSTEIREYPIGGSAIDEEGSPLPDAVKMACQEADAVLLGCVGGTRWDKAPRELRPETGLLELRRALGVYCNLRPVQVGTRAANRSPLRREIVSGTDLLIVRELTGGLYFGEPRGLEDAQDNSIESAFNTMRYNRKEILRVSKIGFDLAGRRKGRVTSVDKANVLEVSSLWRDIVSDLGASEYPSVSLDHMYVDNAAMQLILDPRRFDVVLTGNLFGDILSDLAATLPGSIGVLPSASIGDGHGLFEPVHGTAEDLAGKDRANPVGAILSVAMMLNFLGEDGAAAAVRTAVEAAEEAGIITEDLARGADEFLGTKQFTDAVLQGVRSFYNTPSDHQIINSIQ